MDKSCEQIEKLLVDYADGELSPSESSRVAEHLSKCERCRTTSAALQRSLELAGIVWADGLEEIGGVGMAKERGVRRWRWRRYAAIAASILVVAGIWIFRLTPTGPKQAEPTLAEIEKEIEDSGRAARLLAATELLTEYPDAQSIVKQQYRYIVKTYPQTPSAAQAKLRIQ
ncbi:MAG TPA: zf-HC2 domain-containing protein [Sedimentisphaerales bacterium]|nr:zf-HC2 domain-containing protein [Sedimentisphaerales bacterium]